jgi:hypothetical protein
MTLKASQTVSAVAQQHFATITENLATSGNVPSGSAPGMGSRSAKLLTNYMEWSPCWEANSRAAGKLIPNV